MNLQNTPDARAAATENKQLAYAGDEEIVRDLVEEGLVENGQLPSKKARGFWIEMPATSSFAASGQLPSGLSAWLVKTQQAGRYRASVEIGLYFTARTDDAAQRMAAAALLSIVRQVAARLAEIAE